MARRRRSRKTRGQLARAFIRDQSIIRDTGFKPYRPAPFYLADDKRHKRLLVLPPPKVQRTKLAKVVSARMVGREPPTAAQLLKVCSNRKSRREVLFAHRSTGKGSKSSRQRTWKTDVQCKTT